MELAGQVLAFQGFPGSAAASNITPDRETGGGNWSDDEYARAYARASRMTAAQYFH
jgi:hypothetical protein